MSKAEQENSSHLTSRPRFFLLQIWLTVPVPGSSFWASMENHSKERVVARLGLCYFKPQGTVVAGGLPGGSLGSQPALCSLPSGKCHNEVVLAPMFERLSTESVQDQLPYSVTLISMPATTEGRRGFSVSVESACSNYATTVQVKE